ncbi:hypothetical protein H4R35_004077 [Dimargaris xerosporica]|nr:hypothetical protein H4R35_004077 [Dimargaris xerosporica]
MNVTQIKRLKVTELRTHLEAAGLPTDGKKDELVARLLEHLGGQASDESANPVANGSTQSDAPPADQAESLGAPSQPLTSKPSTDTSAAAILQCSDEERLRRRAERFGLPVKPVAEPSDLQDPEKIKKRMERFGTASVDPAEEEKKRKRAERFGLLSNPTGEEGKKAKV